MRKTLLIKYLCSTVLIGLAVLTNAETLFLRNAKTYVHRQTDSTRSVNQLDSNGLRTGMWISSYWSTLYERYYKNGLRHGVYVNYSCEDGESLSAFGEEDGDIYLFDGAGFLTMVGKYICRNEEEVENWSIEGLLEKPKHRIYITEYYRNGEKKVEGELLYFDSIEIEGYDYKVGVWKYYDDLGRLVKEENNPVRNYRRIYDTTVINKYDSNGLRLGLWEGFAGDYKYFKSGHYDGICCRYTDGILRDIGEYSRNNRTDDYYYFDDNGFLSFCIKGIKVNDEYIRNKDGDVYLKPDYKGYATVYYPNGETRAEGNCVFYEDNKISYFRIGEWKLYDMYGNMEEREYDKLPFYQDDDSYTYPVEY